MNYYTEDDERLGSPGLEEVRPCAKPAPSPPPKVSRSQPLGPEDLEMDDEQDQKHQRRIERRNNKPSLSDRVIVASMNPNYPDIARSAARNALESAAPSDIDTDDEDERLPRPRPGDAKGNDRLPVLGQSGTPQLDHIDMAQRALLEIAPHDLTPKAISNEEGRDRIQQQAQMSPSSPTQPQTGRPRNLSLMGNLAHDFSSMDTGSGASRVPMSKLDEPSTNLTKQRNDSVATGPGNVGDQMSPRLRSLSIPHERINPDSTLPAFRRPPIPDNLDVNRPSNNDQTLPGFQQLSELADAAARGINDSDASPSYVTSRTSFSSASGGAGSSPTLVAARHYSIGSSVSSARSPSSAFPQTSPISTASEISPREPFLFSTPFSNQPFAYHRRQSQASEGGAPYGSLASPASSETLSPLSQHTSPKDFHNPHRMSIDGAVILPPPQPQGLHSTTTILPLPGINGFKCDYPNCTSPPFQTQYLLNSHANVHSSNRPHYCPVPGCARAEGGKGFKRKNEMIRHGLVHDSPGYVCPFCPERDHRYPRPDNLQRHVRVHHPDKDKDDAHLREVLAQRPEGGGRGRRRRVGERLDFR